MLVGADSLRIRRSGVGRMTAEIARTARNAPGVGQVKLLMGAAVLEASALDSLGEFVGAGKAAGFDWRTKLAHLPGIEIARRIRGAGLRRRVKALAQEHPGRFVYYEPNMIARRLDVPIVATINDLSWHHEPSWHPADRLAWIGRHLDDTLRRARRFTALSQFTKDAAVAALGIAPGRIDVVSLAPAREFQPIGAPRPPLCWRGSAWWTAVSCCPPPRSSRARTSPACSPPIKACRTRCDVGRHW